MKLPEISGLLRLFGTVKLLELFLCSDCWKSILVGPWKSVSIN